MARSNSSFTCVSFLHFKYVMHSSISPPLFYGLLIMSQLHELLIADGGLECCPQPWKRHLEHAITFIENLQVQLALQQPELSQTSGKSVDCLAAKRIRDEASNMRSSSFGQPPFSNLVFTSLAVAIDAWEAAGETKTRHALPKFNIVATVVKWGVPTRTKGTITSK